MFQNLFFRFGWQILLATGLGVVSAFAGVAMLSLVTDLVSNFESQSGVLKYSFISFLGAIVAIVFFGVFSQFVFLKLSTSVIYEVQRTLLQRIMATEYEQVEKVGPNRITATMEEDVSKVSDGLLMLPGFVNNFVTVILCIGYMVYMSWELFLFVAFFISFIIFGARITLRYALVKQEAARELMDTFFANLDALGNGGKEIHLNENRRRHFYLSVMIPLFESIKEITIKIELMFIALDTYTSTLTFLLVGSVVYTASYFLPGLQVETIVAFLLVILYFRGPLAGVVAGFSGLNEIRVALRKIKKLGLAESSDFKVPGVVGDATRSGYSKIRFENVCYRYDAINPKESKSFSLGPVSGEFKSGEVSFITGRNGSGKSTFVNLLAGLYKPDSGSIYLDNKSMAHDADLTEFRRNVSIVFSDFYLFSQLINLDGNPASDDLILTHLRELKIDNKVSSTMGLLSTINLSDGQRKRLALLQSRIDDAQVCIYDELAANQDPIFKRYFYCEMLPVLKSQGKIVIIISHDDHYFHVADQVFKFDEGKMISITETNDFKFGPIGAE